MSVLTSFQSASPRPPADRLLPPGVLCLVAFCHLAALALLAQRTTPAPPLTAPVIVSLHADPAPVAPAPQRTATPAPRPASRPPAAAPLNAPTDAVAPVTAPAAPVAPSITGSSAPGTPGAPGAATGTGAAATPVPSGGTTAGAATVTPPVFSADYLQNPAPAYPNLARRLGQQGKVLLRVRVNPAGQAEALEIRSSSGHPLLDNAALDAVKRWRFVPARQGDQPVPAWVVIPLNFTLQG